MEERRMRLEWKGNMRRLEWKGNMKRLEKKQIPDVSIAKHKMR